jgi:cell volume regulation protein A
VDAKHAIATLAIMLGAGLVARLIADALRLPEMLVLLVVGALIGPAVLGWADVALESTGSQLLLTLGVSFILFRGGLGLSVRVLSGTAVGLGLLVVPGVILTAGITGLVAAAAFGEDILIGLLIGAALAPTDPAILIPLFDRLGLRAKVGQTIVAESALNDPMGAVLALAIAAAIVTGESIAHPVVEFTQDVALSTAIGVIFGIALSIAIASHRFGIWRESAVLAVITVVMASFISIDFAGGSGYLGAFLAGLIVGNMALFGLEMWQEHAASLDAVVTAISDVVVILVFILLGMNLPFGAIRAEFLPALAVVATLVVVARPLTVAACLLPDRRGRWQRDELVFIAWTRETGVVPAALAGILIGLHVPGAELVSVCVALALVVTVSVQSTTKRWLARRLRLLDGDPGDL